jgi:hypothetical protein
VTALYFVIILGKIGTLRQEIPCIGSRRGKRAGLETFRQKDCRRQNPWRGFDIGAPKG